MKVLIKKIGCILVSVVLIMSVIVSNVAVAGSSDYSRKLSDNGVTWTGREWDGLDNNYNIVQIGREYGRVNSFPYQSLDKARCGANDYEKDDKYVQYLSQNDWKFAIIENPALFDKSEYKDFYKPSYDVSKWDDIFVPMSWQNAGYDKPAYQSSGAAFLGNYGNAKIGLEDDKLYFPVAPTVYNPIGLYRYTFTVPADWKGNSVFINFEGVKSAYYLWINGKQVGYAEDSFTTDEFDITPYIKAGEKNTIALKVYRWADSSWLEGQDMIDLSGIFRDVFIYTTPNVRVRDYNIVTDFDKTFTDSTVTFDYEIKNYTSSKQTAEVKFRLFDEKGKEVKLNNNSAKHTVNANATLDGKLTFAVAKPHKWSAEDPYLYTAVIEETMGGKTVYESYLVGFRKITYKTTDSGWYEGESTTDKDIIRINGKPIMFRGVNRHDSTPDMGNYVSQEVYLKDITIMKENNINAIRTSHYPNDPYLYYLCDKYGIYVIGEANMECHRTLENHGADDTNQRIDKYFTRMLIDREYNMVQRDRNHACIVAWSLGNETRATNDNVLGRILHEPFVTEGGETLTLHQYEKTRPWGFMGDVNGDFACSMYGTPKDLKTDAVGVQRSKTPFVKIEYAHSMGNALGSLNEFWKVFEADEYHYMQGGFVWDFVDQTVQMTKKDLDGNDVTCYTYGGQWGDTETSGLFCHNGVVNPDRTPQPEINEIKYQHRLVKFEADDINNGRFTVKNFHLFADITKKYNINWEIYQNDEVIGKGNLNDELSDIPTTSAETGAAGKKQITIKYSYDKSKIKAGSEYFIKFSVTLKSDDGLLKSGYEVAYDQFKIENLPDAKAVEIDNSYLDSCSMSIDDGEKTAIFTGDNFKITLDKDAGTISSYIVNDGSENKELLSKGPVGKFYRAPTSSDNDIRDALSRILGSETPTVTGCTVDKSDKSAVKVTFDITYEQLYDLKMQTVYTVYANGQIKVDAKINPVYKGELSCLPVVGMQMQIPAGFENVEYFGKGSFENYSDRADGAVIDRYKTTVDDMYFPYMVPGDTGNRTDVRYVSITNDDGFGLMVSSEQPFEMSALHYHAEAINIARHTYEVKKSEETILRINTAQCGVGGNSPTSGGYLPQLKYVPRAKEYRYSYTISPIFAGKDAMEEHITPIVMRNINADSGSGWIKYISAVIGAMVVAVGGFFAFKKIKAK